MRSKLLKIAIFLGIVSVLPSVVLITRKETPPEKISVKTNREQVIEDFTLRSSSNGKRWNLEAPKAILKENGKIYLSSPVLIIFGKQKTSILAKEALYDEREKKVFLKEVYIHGKNLKGRAKSGIYYVDEETFKTDSFCEFVFNSDKLIKGKGCEIDLKTEKVIILDSVKSVFGEVVKWD
jgi:hypothetical protein